MRMPGCFDGDSMAGLLSWMAVIFEPDPLADRMTMKTLFRVLLLMLSAWCRQDQGVKAQDLRLYVRDRVIACQSFVDVPVQASRFRGMLTMQGGISWDPSILRFDTIVGRGPSVLALSQTNFGTGLASGGQLFFSWDDPLLLGVSLPDSVELFVARFTVLTRSPTAVAVRVGSDSVDTEFIDTTRRRLQVVQQGGTLQLLFEIPSFNPFSDTTRICGSTGVLDAGAGFSRYAWDSVNRSRTLPISRNGLYRVTVVNDLQCRGSDSTLVTFLPVPDGTLRVLVDTLLCEGNVRVLAAEGGVRYRWYRNDTLLAGHRGDTLQARVGGRYRVELFNTEGCSRKLAREVTLTYIPRVRLSYDIRGICSEVPVTFLNRSVSPGIGTIDWLWRFGDGANDAGDSVVHVYRDTGRYRVQLIYRNSHCPTHTDTLSKSLALVRLKDIRYRVVLTVPDYPTTVSARDTGVLFQWIPGRGLSDPRIRDPKATLSESQTYLVRVTFRSGCVVFDTLDVKVARKPGIHVPKAFTPNGDGHNDRLRPILVGIADLWYFRVFNRWGNLLYESRGSSSQIGWDGVYRGVRQPMDTYVWTAVGLDVGGNILREGGNTLLMR